MNSREVFIHIHQGCFAGTGAIVRLPQCQWSKPDGYGKISQCITTAKHSKAKTVCIFLEIYCMLNFQQQTTRSPLMGGWIVRRRSSDLPRYKDRLVRLREPCYTSKCSYDHLTFLIRIVKTVFILKRPLFLIFVHRYSNTIYVTLPENHLKWVQQASNVKYYHGFVESQQCYSSDTN